MFDRPKNIEPRILRERFVEYENKIKTLPISDQVNLEPYVNCLHRHFALYTPARYFAIREDLDELHRKLFPKEAPQACTHNKELEEYAPKISRRARV